MIELSQPARVVVHVTVPVLCLCAVQVRDHRVRRQEPPHLRIKHPPVHVDQAARHVLVVGVAARGGRRDAAGRVVRAVRLPSSAPGIIAQGRNLIASLLVTEPV